MGDAFNEIRVELHTYSEAVSHKKKGPKSKAKKTLVFEGTSGHPQWVPARVARNRAIFRSQFQISANQDKTRP